MGNEENTDIRFVLNNYFFLRTPLLLSVYILLQRLLCEDLERWCVSRASAEDTPPHTLDTPVCFHTNPADQQLFPRLLWGSHPAWGPPRAQHGSRTMARLQPALLHSVRAGGAGFGCPCPPFFAQPGILQLGQDPPIPSGTRL